MRYYVYVSDSKVDMLYSQMPRGIRDRIAAELKIDLKVISVSVSGKRSEETRYSKLQLVTTFLEKNASIGSVHAPEAYFRGRLPMRWGPYGSEDSEMVYFGAVTSGTVVGLGGSMQHVIGAMGESVAPTGTPGLSSAPFYITSVLRHELGLTPASVDDDELGLEDTWNSNVLHATRRMRGPLQGLEFLARRLLFGRYHDTEIRVLPGTPIYVALAE